MGSNIVGYLTILVCVIHLVLLCIVLGSRKSNKHLFGYVAIIISILLWSISTFFYNSFPFGNEIIWLKIVYFFTNFILVSYVIFVYTFPKIVKIKIEFLLWIILVLIVPSMYVLLWGNNLVVDVVHISSQHLSIAKMGSDYFVYMLPTLFGLIVISVYFFLKAKIFTGYQKTQIIYFWIGSILMFYPIILLDYIFPLFGGITKYYRWGPVFGLFFNVFIVYSMLTTRFLGVKSIIGNFIKYILAFIGNSIIVIATYFVVSIFSNNPLSIYSLLFILLISVPILIYFNRVLYKSIAIRIDNLYINPYVNFNQEFEQYSLILEDELDIKRIGKETITFLSKIFGCDSIMLFISDAENQSPIFNKSINVRYVQDDELLRILENWDLINKDNIVLLSEIETFESSQNIKLLSEWKRMLTFMKYNRISIMHRIPKKIGLHGLIALGFYDSERMITRIDVKIVDDIGLLLSKVIGRSVLYTRTRNFNVELQKMVKEQTKEILEKMENMERMRQRERDMLDIMGHELRTPLTIIKNALELVDITHKESKKKGRKLVWNDMIGKQFEHIRLALRRELGIVETLLAATKIDADRLQVNMVKVDLSKVIRTGLLVFEPDARDKGLEIRTDFVEGLYVMADTLYIQQVIDNLLSNAVKYTSTGYIGISVEELDTEVCVKIYDTGEGIGSDELKNLGKKFYRANQYINGSGSGVKTSVVRPGGTGLGLYVTFGLIRAMGGRYEVESELGKGSTFRVYLLRG